MQKITHFSLNLLAISMIFILLAGCSSTANVKEFSKNSGINDDFLLSELNVTTSPGMTLDMQSDAGAVKIKPGSSNEVRVKVYGDNETKEKIDYSAVSTSSGVSVKSKLKEAYKNNSGNIKIRFEIEVPSSYNVKVTTGGGSINISEITGEVILLTGGGSITIDKTTGDISINTGGGSVKISDNTGTINVNTGGGSVTLNSFDGNVNVNTGGGSVTMSGSNGSVDVNTGGGSISLDYSGVNNGIELTTGGGSITLDIPSNFAANVNLNTNVGTISSDFGTPEKNGMGSNLVTTINGGGEKLECSTNAGSIRVNYK